MTRPPPNTHTHTHTLSRHLSRARTLLNKLFFFLKSDAYTYAHKESHKTYERQKKNRSVHKHTPSASYSRSHANFHTFQAPPHTQKSAVQIYLKYSTIIIFPTASNFIVFQPPPPLVIVIFIIIISCYLPKGFKFP